MAPSRGGSSDGVKTYAIVAIPAADQAVWNLSSEKVPHLTLLMLGEDVENTNRIIQFVGHAASAFRTFYLPVKSRGELGDKPADVLFFDTDYIHSIADFRNTLLANPDISAAYNSVDQYPEWIPHLTLGFPESPAKADAEQAYPAPGVLSVGFDRIAVWTGDYEGVEFPLNDTELSMSERGAAFLAHYGVKGMKWGVIRDRAKGAHQTYKKVTVSEDARRTKKVRGKAKVIGVDALSNKELQTVITRMNLEQQYSTLKRVEHEQSLLGAGKRWAGNFVTDVLKDVAGSWAKRPGSNFSGRTSRRGRAWIGNQPTIDGSFTPRAIG